MIVTLAGHVDHGKTALVRALTGVDTDRLEIEKKRGLTIDLGFAYGEFAGARVGFVDVPGHQKFVRNMIAGVSRQQFALLVVAADEGPMPQTAEHLDILETIGLLRGAVVYSRTDLADAGQRAQTLAATRALLEGSFLHNADMHWCSVRSGEGMDALKQALAAQAGTGTRDLDQGHFRMCVDRAFHLSGAGLIVTGSVHSGEIHTGDTVSSSRVNRTLRVRSLRVSDQSADAAAKGDRAALNITGIDLEQVKRGDWLLAPKANVPTRRLSIEFRAAQRLPRSLRKWTPVHLHHGAAHLTGRLGLIERSTLNAGDTCFADCLLDEAIVAKWGDRVLIRDAGSESTLGGGPVIDTCIAKRAGRKWSQGRGELLSALALDDPIASLHEALAHKQVLDFAEFSSLRNQPESDNRQRLAAAGIRVLEVDDQRQATLEATYQLGKDEVLRRINAWHERSPDSPGLGIDLLRRESDMPSGLLRQLIADLVAGQTVRIHAGMLRAAEFRAHRSGLETDLLTALEGSTNKTPTLGDLENALSLKARELLAAAKRLESAGEIIFVNERRLVHRDTLEQAIDLAGELSVPQGFVVRDFRDRSGLGRNACIDILEYLDRTGVTRRIGDRRRLNSKG